MVLVRLVAVVVVAACGSQPAGPPQNVTSGAGAYVAVAPDQPLGRIGIAPLRAPDAGDWLPAGAQAVLVPLPAEGLAPGAALSAIDSAGRTARVTAGAPAKVPYGCDGNQLDVLPFTGGELAPGPVWLLPPGAPAAWSPRALAIASPGAATEAQRRYTVGPLSLELARTDRARGTLAIVRGGRALHQIAIERGEMEGAEPTPLDIRSSGVAIPEPVGAWSLAEEGPFLLILRVPSYEGVNVTAILVEDAGARELPELAIYLYRCAF
ncbi:MAG TPA: hypothetical protein VNO30_42205 [Kofleriaceae bacterium]|nr:hypothetical protein [Kofleriaceae bacterium]